MKNLKLAVVFLLFVSCVTGAEKGSEFDTYFEDRTMRVDYFHVGDAAEEIVTIDRIYQEGIWAGSRKNLIDSFNNGRYYAKVYDLSSGQLLYSKGFDSYFGEYKTTGQAAEGTKRTYHESVLFPYPKDKVRFALEWRKRDQSLKEFFSAEIDPSSVDIIKEKSDRGVKVFEVHKSGDPHTKVDIAFIAEGYTLEEEAKLEKDLERLSGVLLGHEPYKSRKSDFNIYGVFKPSAESGCDEPRSGIFKKTAVSATFNSLGSERYMLTEDNKALRDIASHVPYDALFLMVNHNRYGGGGIYNLYCAFTTDNQWYEYLLLHEFGHSFAGLADEYYTSSVAYNDFYPKGMEPLEANITALLDPDNLKWKDLLSPGIEVPTPWEKGEFDRMDLAYQKVRQELNEKIARMKREGIDPAEVEKVVAESEDLSKKNADRVDAYLLKSKYWDKVGVFEGAGYSAQGLYRPMLDCLMFTKGDKSLCIVCEQAVIRVIDHYTK